MKRKSTPTPILHTLEQAGKTFSFDEAHDPRTPADLWYQESDEGLIVFVVFYSQACRWSRCLGCNLPSKGSPGHVSFKALMAQVDHVFRELRDSGRCDLIHKIIVSNNGSVLDEATFSSTALIYLLAQCNLHLPNLATLCIETRPQYVDLAELEFLARALAEGDTPTHLEIAIGFEAFDDHIRNHVYNKGLSRNVFERLARAIAPYGYWLKCYFMQKPVPGMSDGEGIEDIHRAIDYLDGVAREHNLRINLHLNPTFVSRGTALEAAFREGRYAPPFLRDVAAAARHARGTSISVFVGLYDEGLAVEGGSFLREGDGPTVEALERFNRTQDYDVLDRICAGAD